MKACMMRAGCKTLSAFSSQHAILCKLAPEVMPIQKSVGGSVIPDGWEGDAFCTNLFRAMSGQGLDFSEDEARGTLDIVARFSSGRVSKSLQSQLYKAIQAAQPNPWPTLLIRRCRELAPDAPPWEFSVQHHQEFRGISKKTGKMATLCV